jgi:tetratricopeptide (TPR) repeat protein
MALGYALWVNGRKFDAERAGSEALRIDPACVDAHILLARLAEAGGDLDFALRHAEDALRFQPLEERAAKLRGRVLIAAGRAEEAVGDLRDALGRNPESPELHELLGWADLHVGRRNEAFHHLREALRLDPNSEQIRVRLVEALKSRSRFYHGLLRATVWFGRRRSLTAATLIALGIGYPVLLVVAGFSGWSAFPWLVAGGGLAILLWVWRGLSGPMFDLLLEFDPFGRRLLTRDQRSAAWTVAGCFAVGAAQGVLGAASPVFFIFAAASTTVVPRLLIKTFAERIAFRRLIRLLFVSPAVILFDLGVTASALSELRLIPESIGVAGAISSIVAVFVFLVGVLTLSIESPPTVG